MDSKRPLQLAAPVRYSSHCPYWIAFWARNWREWTVSRVRAPLSPQPLALPLPEPVWNACLQKNNVNSNVMTTRIALTANGLFSSSFQRCQKIVIAFEWTHNSALQVLLRCFSCRAARFRLFLFVIAFGRLSFLLERSTIFTAFLFIDSSIFSPFQGLRLSWWSIWRFCCRLGSFCRSADERAPFSVVERAPPLRSHCIRARRDGRHIRRSMWLELGEDCWKDEYSIEWTDAICTYKGLFKRRWEPVWYYWIVVIKTSSTCDLWHIFTFTWWPQYVMCGYMYNWFDRIYFFLSF